MATTVIGLFGFVLFLLVLYMFFELSYNGIVLANGVYLFIRFFINYALLNYCGEVKQYDDCHFFSKETVSGLLPMFQKGMGGMTVGAL